MDNRVMYRTDACVTCGRLGFPHADWCQEVNTWAQSMIRGRQGNGRPAARCGTASGYHAHHRRGEAACRPCKDAVNVYQRAWKARRHVAS